MEAIVNPVIPPDDGSVIYGDKACPDKGPCRETAVTMIRKQIDSLESRLKNRKALLSVARLLATGSEAEEALWSLLCAERASERY